MKLRIIKPEGLWAIGDIIEPEQDDVSRLLIVRKIAVEHREEFPPPNKMVRREKVKTKA